MKCTILLGLTVFLFCTTSSAVENGKMAPDFKLMGADSKEYRLSEFKNEIVVLEWLNHGCPFVKKHYGSNNMQKIQKKYKDKGVKWLSIISSAKGKQGYVSAEAALKEMKSKSSNSSMVLLDPSGKVGKLYGAKTTPHMFIINKKGLLAYQGAIDSESSTNPEDINGATNYVTEALDQILTGKKVTLAKTRPYGCSVKY